MAAGARRNLTEGASSACPARAQKERTSGTGPALGLNAAQDEPKWRIEKAMPYTTTDGAGAK